MPPKLVYNPRYNITAFGLERLHPFDSRKYGRAYGLLRAEFGSKLKQHVVCPRRPARRRELLTAHSDGYLRDLRRLDVLRKALEVPIPRYLFPFLVHWRVLRPMRWATMGTVVAAREAMQHGLAINLSGGYHHAKHGNGEGFCIYSDIAIAVRRLRAEGLLGEESRIAYIDLDAHQGNGVCHQFMDDRRVFIFDMYNSATYPCYDKVAQRRIDCDLPLDTGCTGTRYLDLLRAELPPFLDGIGRTRAPDLAIYNAGTDIFEGDPLGVLRVPAEHVLERDLFAVHELRRRKIPTVMLLSGGYTKDSYKLVARSVGELLKSA